MGKFVMVEPLEVRASSSNREEPKSRSYSLAFGPGLFFF